MRKEAKGKGSERKGKRVGEGKREWKEEGRGWEDKRRERREREEGKEKGM